MICKNRNLYTIIFILAYIASFFVKYMNFNYEDSQYHLFHLFIKNVILPLSFLIMLFQFSFSSKKELFLICALGCLCLLVGYFSADFFIVTFLVFIVLSKNINLKLFLQVIFWISLILFIYVVFDFLVSYYINDSANYLMDGNFGKRYTFGLFHPNAFPLRFFLIVSLYILIRRNITLYELIILSLLNLFIFQFAHSRTSFYLAFLLLFVAYIHQYIPFLKVSLLRKLSQLSFFIIFIVWLLLSYFYLDFKGLLTPINSILSDRIYISYLSLTDLPIKLLGNNIKHYMEVRMFSIDVLYMYMLLSYGPLFLCLYGIALYKLIGVLNKHRLYKEVIVITSFLLYALLERTMIDITLNYTLIFLSFLLYKDNLYRYINRK